MLKKNSLKILGLIASGIGFGATLLTNWVSDKQLDEKIDERVQMALAESEEDDEIEEDE